MPAASEPRKKAPVKKSTPKKAAAKKAAPAKRRTPVKAAAPRTQQPDYLVEDPDDPDHDLSRGERGRTGKQGVPGLSIQGVQGDKGDPGEGRPGIMGLTGRQGEKGEPGKTTVTTAQGLTDALRENTDALNQVKRRYRGTAVVAVIALLGVIFSFYVRYDSRISSCERDNQIRGGLLRIASSLEVLIGDPDPGEVAFIGQLREDFALRECDSIGYVL